jgi:hypothetical protein
VLRVFLLIVLRVHNQQIRVSTERCEGLSVGSLQLEIAAEDNPAITDVQADGRTSAWMPDLAPGQANTVEILTPLRRHAAPQNTRLRQLLHGCRKKGRTMNLAHELKGRQAFSWRTDNLKIPTRRKQRPKEWKPLDMVSVKMGHKQQGRPAIMRKYPARVSKSRTRINEDPSAFVLQLQACRQTSIPGIGVAIDGDSASAPPHPKRPVLQSSLSLLHSPA